MKKVRDVIIYGDVAHVPLTKGYTAIIDAEDVDIVGGYNWSALIRPNAVYAVRKKLRSDGKKRLALMHREIMRPPSDMQIDHKNHNGIDNRKSNLRICSQTENNYNTRLGKNNRCGLKGVWWSERDRRWYSRIQVDGEQKSLGVFATKEEAHAAYLNASKKYHGEFSCAG